MAGGLIGGPERFGEAARARLKLDEVPTEPARSRDCDGRQRFRRPLLVERVAPRADWWAVGHTHRKRSLDPFAARHWFEFKLDSVTGIEGGAARLRAAAEA